MVFDSRRLIPETNTRVYILSIWHKDLLVCINFMKMESTSTIASTQTHLSLSAYVYISGIEANIIEIFM